MSVDLDIDFANVCRCCLSANEALTSLTAKSIVEGYLLYIPDVVEATIGVQLTIDFQRPSQICPTCKTQLIGYHTFKEKCTRINAVLSTVDPSDLDVEQDTCCRICLNTPEKVTNLRSKTIVDGNLMALPDLAIDCLAFEIHEDDNFSQKICASCKTQLVNFFTFREKFKRSEITLDNVFSHPTEAQDTIPCVESTEILENEATCEIVEDESEEESMTIQELMGDTSEQDVLQVNYKTEETESENGVSEIIDDERDEMETFSEEEMAIEENEHFIDDAFSIEAETDSNFGILEPDMQNVEVQIVKPVQSIMSKAEGVPGKCKKCLKGFYGPNAAKDHTKYHKALDLVVDFLDFFHCRHCSIVCVDADSLEVHHTQSHPQIPFEPSEKSATKDDLAFLEDEISTVASDYVCDVCGVGFKEVTGIKNHLLVQHLEVMACSMCGISYNSLVRLASHLTLKHLNTEFRCRHCKSAEFKSYFDFKNHLKKSCPARRFLCTHCNKYFLSSKSRAAHMAVAESKNFQCHCGKKFRQKGELTIHERVHTGEKNFPCTICGKRYRTSSMRADHMDTHIVGKTFECTFCHIMLQTRTVLRNHLRRHTEGKTHCCQHCPKTFHTKYHLKMHVEKIHTKKEKQNRKSSFED